MKRLLLLLALAALLAAPAFADNAKTADVPEDASAAQTIGSFFDSLFDWIAPTHFGAGYAWGSAGTGSEIELLSYEFAHKDGWGSLFADAYLDPTPAGGGISAGPDAIKPVFIGGGVYREKFVVTAGLHLEF